MEVTARQLEIIRHSLGVGSDGRARSYRNYYCQPIDCESDELVGMREMVEMGLLKEGRTINGGRDQYFIVTDLGIEESRKRILPLPKLTRGQKMYRAYLNMDICESFQDFLTNPYWADARKRALG